MKIKNENDKVPDKIISAADFMPQNEIAKGVLLERAKHLAKIEINRAQENSLTKYICFRLGQRELYGIPYDKIKEVMNNVPITRMPNVPSFVAGVINRRGALIAVIDLNNFFHHETVDDKSRGYTMIITSKKMVAGILVDSIEDAAAYNAFLLDPPIPSLGVSSDFILGIDQGTIPILNIDVILSTFSDQLNIKLQK